MYTYRILSIAVIFIVTLFFLLVFPGGKRFFSKEYFIGVVFSMLVSIGLSFLYPVTVGKAISKLWADVAITAVGVLLIYIIILVIAVMWIPVLVSRRFKNEKKESTNKIEKEKKDANVDIFDKSYEKIVDSERIIDTMDIEEQNDSLENLEDDSEKSVKDIAIDAIIRDYIDEAFSSKQQGRFYEAINWYLKVLDKKPDKSLVFWVVLDICVLYKQMGQIGLAKDILENYLTHYGDVMDASTRKQIEENLVS